MRGICILTFPRTGSNHIMKLLSCFDSINDRGELFKSDHPGAFGREEKMLIAAQSSGVTIDDEGIIGWKTQFPGQMIDIILSLNPNRTLLFKLNQYHLNRNLIERDITSRNDLGFMILNRKPIESYISDYKAHLAQNWLHKETTDLKPMIYATHFIEWAQSTRSWYEWMERSTKDRPRFFINYDRDISGRPVGDIISTLNSSIEGIGCQPLFSGLSLQDREPSYWNRVANWNEFQAEMNAMSEGKELLEWAEAVP